MERDREIAKLINVLYRIARGARYAEWNNASDDAARFCLLQYNRVLARLRELEPAIATLFTELPEAANPQVIRIAAHELSAYFEEEPRTTRHRRRHCGGVGVRVGFSPFS
jgi:hypothetical protein